MAYKQRPGVVMLDVCGAKILAAQRSVWEDCSSKIQPVGILGHICWKALNKDISKDLLIHAISSLSRKSEKEAEAQIEEYYQKLLEMGFLIEVPDEEETHDES